MREKKYRTIKEVSELLGINPHVIRYWDSKSEGLSTRIHLGKQRFFNIDNIRKLKELKNTLYDNGKHNYSLDLAKKIMNNKGFSPSKNIERFNIINEPYKNKLNIKNLKDIRRSLYEVLDD